MVMSRIFTLCELTNQCWFWWVSNKKISFCKFVDEIYIVYENSIRDLKVLRFIDFLDGYLRSSCNKWQCHRFEEVLHTTWLFWTCTENKKKKLIDLLYIWQNDVMKSLKIDTNKKMHITVILIIIKMIFIIKLKMPLCNLTFSNIAFISSILKSFKYLRRIFKHKSFINVLWNDNLNVFSAWEQSL